MYPLVSIPSFANKSFYDFTHEESKRYFNWFLKIRNERIDILESNVQLLYPKWKADYSRSSLNELYDWLGKQVEYRLMTDDEKMMIKDQISSTPLFIDVIPIPNVTFTDETVSICFDTGIYFGETLIKNIPDLMWIQKLNSKKFIDYAQPLISRKKSKVPVNPRRVAENIASSFLDREQNEITFEELFDKWTNKF